MRSDMIKKGFERAPHRSLLRATGVIRSEADFDKPFIAIANSYTDIIPGHVHLNEFGEVVRAGGARGRRRAVHVQHHRRGRRHRHGPRRHEVLACASRELIADCVETMVAAHCFDGMVCIPNCDKIVPGMLMAAMRVNIPTIFVSGGPMTAGVTPAGRVVDLISVFEGVGGVPGRQDQHRGADRARAGRLPDLRLVLRHVHRQLDELPVRGAGHGAARQRHDPGRRSAPRGAGAARPARQIMTLIDMDLQPRDIVTAEAIDNAFALDMAMGGSTNTVLHTLALAREAGVDYPLARLNEVARARAEHLQGLAVVALSHRGRGPGRRHLRHPVASCSSGRASCTATRLTVTGKTLGRERRRARRASDTACIRPLDEPVQRARRADHPVRQPGARGRGGQDGGRAARDAAAPRPGGRLRLARRGQRRHPERQGEGRRRGGDPLRGAEGRAGDAGDAGADLEHHGHGAGHVGRADHRRPLQRRARAARASATSRPRPPPAARSACVQDGDIIDIDIPARPLGVEVSDEELARRKANWQPPQRELTGWLKRYAAMVTSGSEGAVLQDLALFCHRESTEGSELVRRGQRASVCPSADPLRPLCALRQESTALTRSPGTRPAGLSASAPPH